MANQLPVNPILVLAASAARGGNPMFAASLLTVSRGARDCKAMRKRITRLRGNSDLSMARIAETNLLKSGNIDLRRPHVNEV